MKGVCEAMKDLMTTASKTLLATRRYKPGTTTMMMQWVLWMMTSTGDWRLATSSERDELDERKVRSLAWRDTLAIAFRIRKGLMMAVKRL